MISKVQIKKTSNMHELAHPDANARRKSAAAQQLTGLQMSQATRPVSLQTRGKIRGVRTR